MDGTIKLPVFGKVKKAYAGAGAAVLLVLAILWYRNRHASSAAAPAQAGQQTDPAGNVGTIDPATGYVYGSPQDQAALAASAGTSADLSGGGGGGGSDIIGYDSNGNPVYGTSTSDQVSSGPPFSSNAAWSQYAISALEGNGYDAASVTSDLGAYLAGSQVTAAQKDVIDAAIAVAGYPPVSGPNGYPPSINLTGSTAGGGPSGASSGSGSSSGTTTGRLAQPQGIRLVLQYTNSVRLQWDEVPGATGYVVQAKLGGDNGQVVNGPFSTTLALANIGGLQKGTRYTALIWPSSKSSQGGPGSNQPHAEFSFSTTS